MSTLRTRILFSLRIVTTLLSANSSTARLRAPSNLAGRGSETAELAFGLSRTRLLRAHLAIIDRENCAFVVVDCAGILADVTGIVDSAGQFSKFPSLDR